MKKIIFIAATVLLIFSCKKSETIQNSSDKLSDLTKEVISQKTAEIIKKSYGMLSVDEMQILWEAKFKSIQKNDWGKFTPAQKQIVLSLQELLTKKGIKFLRANPKVGDDFLAKNLPYYEQHFTKQQLNMLIECAYYKDGFSILSADAYFKEMEPIVDIDGGGGSYSGDCTCRYSISCTGSGNKCDATCVAGGTADCGVFGTSKCTNKCSLG